MGGGEGGEWEGVREGVWEEVKEGMRSRKQMYALVRVVHLHQSFADSHGEGLRTTCAHQ